MPNNFQNILPDPNYGLTSGGGAGTDYYGPGFASMKLSSQRPIMRDRTNSGRVISRANMYHKWSIDINYNPMTKEQFLPVYSFLMEKQGSLKPFFISLPQYRNQTSGASVGVRNVVNAGSTLFEVDTTEELTPGMLFHIDDSTDSNHTKAYTISVVETSNDYFTDRGAPPAGVARVTVSPALAKNVSASATLELDAPLIQVVQTSDVQEYSLGSNGLYAFNLKVEEVTY